MSVNTMAYGAVAVVAVVLFAIGTPAERSRQAALNAPSPAPPASVVAAASAPPSVSAAGVTLQSVSFDLPVTDKTYPGGAEADVMNANCASCHSPGMVMMQPSLTRATWTEEVNKMRNIYKAPVAAEDVPAIVAYLADLRPAP